jgi:hypothetical protein
VIRATVDFTGSHLERITAVLPEVCSDRPPMTMPTSGRAIGAPGTRLVARMTADLEELICHRSRNCTPRRVGPPCTNIGGAGAGVGGDIVDNRRLFF